MLALLIALIFHAQTPIKPSQHGAVSQQVAGTTISIEYDRPVARGRELFGTLVPYDRVWCPGANECTTITFSTDVKLNGNAVAAGTYTLWAKPGEKTWTMILNRAHPTFHTQHARVEDQDFLKIDVTPKAGSQMETLAFYFPVVDGRHAEL